MYNKYLSFLLILLSVITKINANEVSVEIENGKINGKIESFDGKEVNVFLGIPYAEPPVGKLRFRRPVPKNGWSEAIEATKWPNPCVQIDRLSEPSLNSNYSEDCLYLNVWSPKLGSSDELKPVMFWIHGGGLTMGSSSAPYYAGDVLSTKGDVVLVTTNYRLGALGFLYTGTDDAPGNVGLWDQSLALEWVNDNIQYFGGDPKQITVFGESAGSWCTSLHVLSPISRNLFSNAIMMSGAYIINSITAKDSIKLWLKVSKKVDCNDNENQNEFTSKIIECLRNVSPDKLKIAIESNELLNGLNWLRLPVIDGKFLPEEPKNMIRTGNYKKNINLMISTVEDEGTVLFQIMGIDMVKYHPLNPKNMSYSESYTELKHMSEDLKPGKVNGEDVAKLYFTGLSDSNGFDLLRRTIGIAVGDYWLGCPTIQFGKEIYSNDKKGSNVYQLYFNSKFKAEYFCSKWMGVCHIMDIFPVFGVPFKRPDNEITAKQRIISEQMIDIYSTFAKTGHPPKQNGVDWPQFYTINDKIIAPYLEITNEPKPVTNFDNNLKTAECDYLWKQYIDMN